MNINLSLTHPYTPNELRTVNQQLEALFAQESLDEAQLLQLISQRDEIVQLHLKSLEKQQLKDFAQAELSVNNVLIENAKGLQSESLGKLSSLIRGRKAVAKYK